MMIVKGNLERLVLNLNSYKLLLKEWKKKKDHGCNFVRL